MGTCKVKTGWHEESACLPAYPGKKDNWLGGWGHYQVQEVKIPRDKELSRKPPFSPGPFPYKSLWMRLDTEVMEACKVRVDREGDSQSNLGTEIIGQGKWGHASPQNTGIHNPPIKGFALLVLLARVAFLYSPMFPP